MPTEGETAGAAEPTAEQPDLGPEPTTPVVPNAPEVAAPRLPSPSSDARPVTEGASAPDAAPAPFQTVSPLGARTSFENLDYDEPELLALRRPDRLVVASRVLLAAWSVAVTIATTVAHRASRPFDGDEVTWVGRAGVPVVVVAALAGWWWSDRRTRNIKRLDGRLPSRLRCATAWMSPLVWSGLLALLLVRADPTEPFDIRPSIIVVVFVASLARPYLLVRRIFTSLTRINSDALIATAAVIDLTSIGLLWWRLTDWPSVITDGTSSNAQVLQGLAFATSIALIVNVFVWSAILRAARVAEDHRLGALQTRQEHRVLRLRGIDPTDPAVWWALVQRRIARERAEERNAAGSARVRAPERLAEDVRTANASLFARLGEHGSAELVGRLRDQFAEVLRTPDGAAEGEPAADDGDGDAPASDLSRRIGTVRERLGLQSRATGSSEAALHRLIDQASLTEVSAALNARDDDVDERFVPPRLDGLEAARYLMLGSFVACAALALWMLSGVLAADTVGDGLLAPEAVSDADVARRALLTALTVALAVVPLYAAVLWAYARKAGAVGSSPAIMLGVAAVNALLAAGAQIVDGDDRGPIGVALTIPAAALCLWVVSLLEPLHRWAAKRPLKSLAWSVGLAGFLVLTVIAGLQRTVEPSDSPLVLAFGLTSAAILWCMIVVVAALDTAEFEEAIRLAPALAVPASSLRRGRRQQRSA